MVDREKVIKALEKCSFRDCPTCPYYSPNDSRCIRELIYDALTLLKEQEAVKPIPFFTETGAESPNYVVCGHCKSIKAIMPKYTKQKYCHECGFPVLWECR